MNNLRFQNDVIFNALRISHKEKLMKGDSRVPVVLAPVGQGCGGGLQFYHEIVEGVTEEHRRGRHCGRANQYLIDRRSR